MIIRHGEGNIVKAAACCGGNGAALIKNLIGEQGTLCAVCEVTLGEGDTVGFHAHTGDNELYYILSGSGVYSDNGRQVILSEGDVAVCRAGESHAVSPSGAKLEFLAVIFK